MKFTKINGTCSTKYTDWVEAGKRYCKGREKYHCLPNESGQYGEMCIPSSWIQSSFCPEYNTVAKKINVVLCDFHHGNCPVGVYSSNQAYKYSGCFNTKGDVITRSTTMSTTEDGNQPLTISTATEHEQTSTGTIVAICVIILIVLVVAIFLTTVVILRKKRRERRSRDQHVVTVPLLEIKKGNEKMGKAQLLKSDEEVQRHKGDKTYYPCNRVIEECWKVLSHYGILVITGISGSGKTKLGLEVISLSLNQYIHGNGQPSICRVVKRLDDCDTIYAADTVTFALLDDCFEKWSYYKDEADFSTDMGVLERLMNNHIVSKREMYVVVTMQIKTWEKVSPKFKESQFLKTCIAYDLSSGKMAFTEEERRQILLKHINTNVPESTECCGKPANVPSSENELDHIVIDDKNKQTTGAIIVEGNTENEDLYLYFRENGQTVTRRLDDTVINQIINIKEKTIGFPEICFLLCIERYFMDKSEEFFEEPLKYLKNRILQWHNSEKGEDKAKYRALAYTLLIGGQINLDNIDSHYATLVESSPVEIIDAVSAISGKYLKELETGVFVFQNDAITSATFSVVGFKHTETLIKHCDRNIFLRFIRTDKFKEAKNTSEMVFCVERTFNDKLINRLQQLKNFGMDVENHKCMEDPNISMKWVETKHQKDEI